tara:strand:+ start:190 stop:723 length:534 start_codon:yes stop_codon:yes gene_type:complete
MIYHSLKKAVVVFNIDCWVLEEEFEERMKEREDLDFKWENFDSQFWDTNDDWGDLFSIYKTEKTRKSIQFYNLPRWNYDPYAKDFSFRGMIDFDSDKLDLLKKELDTFNDYFVANVNGKWKGYITIHKHPNKEMINQGYNLESGEFFHHVGDMNPNNSLFRRLAGYPEELWKRSDSD